jgi:hypothetical protein
MQVLHEVAEKGFEQEQLMAIMHQVTQPLPHRATTLLNAVRSNSMASLSAPTAACVSLSTCVVSSCARCSVDLKPWAGVAVVAAGWGCC